MLRKELSEHYGDNKNPAPHIKVPDHNRLKRRGRSSDP
jgi:hypothetical protein